VLVVNIGEIVGRYRVVGRIGSGGMATVYAGQHTVLRHSVAIKVLHPEHIANRSMRLRLINEARAVAAIRHPGIVELFDIGKTTDGRTYVVLELLEGESLDERLAAGPMPIDTAVRFGRQIASAVAAAHARGIVHRDLKPQNVFIVPDAEVVGGERIKILDFGIAKRTTVETPMPEITATGVVIGTPEYMSPEQCRGDDEIDGRADIYSLGVVLYQMVTGELPFDKSGTEEQLMRHMYASPPKVGCEDPAMDEVIARCMAKDPAQRFDTMDDVAAMLTPRIERARTAVNIEPAPPPPSPPRHRRYLLVGACAGAALALVSVTLLGVGSSGSSVERSSVDRSEARAPAVVAPAPTRALVAPREKVAAAEPVTRKKVAEPVAQKRVAKRKAPVKRVATRRRVAKPKPPKKPKKKKKESSFASVSIPAVY
jgi:serine/threonine-protein kinase